MFYATKFNGCFIIDPPLEQSQVNHLNKFFIVQHDKNHYPSNWCDWEISKDGTTLSWNRYKYSYSMHEWATRIVKEIPNHHKLSGTIFAKGEAHDDRWVMTAYNRLIVKCNLGFDYED